MSVQMAEMGKEHQEMEKARKAESRWLKQENNLLKDALGWVKESPPRHEAEASPS